MRRIHILLGIIGILLSCDVFASHIMGGELTYLYGRYDGVTGKFKYEVTLRMYRDMTGISCPSDVDINVKNDDATFSTYGSFSINQSNSFTVEPPGLAACGLSLPFSVQVCEYKDTISLDPSILGYHLYWGSCCRNSAIANVPDDGSTYYTYIPPTYFKNSSPQFTDLAIPYLCANDTTTILNGAVDPDGDLLVFTFVTPYDNVGTFSYPITDTLVYNTGYSMLKPFGNGGMANINSSTGITEYFAPYSPTDSVYVIAVEVQEYRNGVQINTIRRDLQFFVLTCPPNPEPDLGEFGGSGQTTYFIEEGQQLCFPVTFYNKGGESDSISITHSGYVFDGNIVANPASMKDTTDKDTVTSKFCWLPVCGEASAVPYIFYVYATDNGCPPKTAPRAYKVYVNEFVGGPDTIMGPDPACSEGQNTYYLSPSTNLTYKWYITGGTIIDSSANDTIIVDWNVVNEGFLDAMDISGCTGDTLSLSIKVDDPPVATAGNDTTICNGEIIAIGKKNNPTYTYAWSPSLGLSDINISNPTANVSSTSTFKLVVTSYPSCPADTDYIAITVNEVNANINDTSICLGQSLGLDVGFNANYVYNWYPSTYLSNDKIHNPVSSPSDTIKYKITVGDNITGCVLIDSVKINVISLPGATAGVDIWLCDGDSVQLGASGGHLYNWNPASGLSNPNIGNPIAFPSDTTMYLVSIIDTNESCTKVDTMYVNVIKGKLIADAGADTQVCKGSSANLLAKGGATYSWSPSAGLSDTGIANPVSNPLITTTYMLIAYSGECIADTDYVEVKVNVLPVVDAGTNKSGCIGDTVSIGFASISGFNYLWLPANDLDDSSKSKPVVSISDTIIYYLALTDTNGCSGADSVKVFSLPLPVIEAGEDKSICTGDSIQLNIPGDISLNYLWTPSITLSGSNISNPIAKPSTTTSYSVLATDANGCKARDTIKVNVSATLIKANAGPDTSICKGIPVTFNASGGSKFKWSPSAGLSDSTIFNPKANPDITTIYKVIIESGACLADTDTVVVYVNLLPEAKTTYKDTSICVGETVKLGVQNVVSTSTYLWSPDNNISNVYAAFPKATPKDTTVYYVSITDTNKCTNSDSVIVNVKSPAADAGADTSICFGFNATIGAVASGTLTYSWSPSTYLDNKNSSNPVVLNAAVSTQYILTVTDKILGCANWDTVNITVNQLPDAGLTNINTCKGETVTLNAQEGHSFTWSPSTGLSSTSVYNPSFTATNNITYYLSLLDTISKCSNKDTSIITVNNRPTAGVNKDTSLCINEPLKLTATGGVQYLWSPAAGLSNVNIYNPIANPSSSIDYMVVVYDNNNCKDTANVKITVNSPSGDAGPDESICMVQEVKLNSNGNPLYLYSWSPPDGLDNANIASPTANPVITTTYIVSITDTSIGCTKYDTVIVDIISKPIDAIAGEDELACLGSPFVLKGFMSTGKYFWWTTTTNAVDTVADGKSPEIYPKSTTSYVLNVYNGYCMERDTVVITVDTLVMVFSNDTTICNGDEIQLQASGADQYFWSPASALSDTTGPDVTAHPALTTDFVVTGVNSKGCQQKDTIQVDVNAKPETYASKHKTIFRGETVQIFALGADYYTWSPGGNLDDSTLADPVAKPDSTTLYTLTGYTNEGCILRDTVSITVLIKPELVIPSAFSPNNDGNNDNISAVDIYDGEGIQNVSFTIFNRWGQIVFQTNNLQQEWDGTRKGKALDMGVYPYYLILNLDNGERIEKKGNIALVR